MKVIVKSYKPSGKWYHTEETQIELQTIDDVLDLEEKIKCNDESIQHLSGLKQGFSQYFTYMIELKSDNLFMDFIIHSNEFIRSSEVFSEKEKNEKKGNELHPGDDAGARTASGCSAVRQGRSTDRPCNR